MRQIVIVIADLYFPPGKGEGSPPGQAKDALPGFEHAARFGETITLKDGWRTWLARQLGRDDLASAAPAAIAAAAFNADAKPAGAALDSAVSVAVPARTVDSTAPNATPTSAVAAGFGAGANKVPLRSSVWIATPLHLIAGLTSLHLDRRSILRLPQAELESFASDFRSAFSDSKSHFKPMSSGDFLISGLNAPRVITTEPARALVSDVGESLPKGADAHVLKRFGAELEMWLHQHPVNHARRRRGQPPVNTLWMWGGAGSAAAAELARDTGRIKLATAVLSSHDAHDAEADLAFGSDAYLAGLWHLHGGHSRPLPDQLAEVFGYPRAHRAILVADVGTMLHTNSHWTVFDALADLDRRFVSPALAALRRGEVDSVLLVANDRRVLVRRNDRLKLWRRSQPGIEGLR